MSTLCKNCGTAVEKNFCTNCGQSVTVQRITTAFVLNDLIHGVFHIHHGLLFTTKELLLRPGQMIRDYLNGRRVKHFRPVTMVLVLSAAYLVISHGMNVTIFETDPNASGKLNRWLETHYSHSELLLLPIFALSSFLMFRKRGENLAEWFTFHAFLTGQRLAITLITMPLMFLIAPDPHDRTFKSVIVGVELAMMIWAFVGFYRGHSAGRTILLGLLSMVISISLAMLVLYVAGLLL